MILPDLEQFKNLTAKVSRRHMQEISDEAQYFPSPTPLDETFYPLLPYPTTA